MKRIFLLSTLVIASFGMMNLQTVSAQQADQQTTSPAVGAQAKKLVSKINQAVGGLHGSQFSTVNKVCIDYYNKLNALGKPTDAQVADLKKNRDEQIKALLEPAQVKQFAGFKD